MTPEKRAKQLVTQMTVEEKIGQILLLDIRRWKTAEETKGLTVLNDEIRSIIRRYHLGNIILFEENCADTKSLCKLTYELQQTAAEWIPKMWGEKNFCTGTARQSLPQCTGFSEYKILHVSEAG